MCCLIQGLNENWHCLDLMTNWYWAPKILKTGHWITEGPFQSPEDTLLWRNESIVEPQVYTGTANSDYYVLEPKWLMQDWRYCICQTYRMYCSNFAWSPCSLWYYWPQYSSSDAWDVVRLWWCCDLLAPFLSFRSTSVCQVKPLPFEKCNPSTWCSTGVCSWTTSFHSLPRAIELCPC